MEKVIKFLWDPYPDGKSADLMLGFPTFIEDKGHENRDDFIEIKGISLTLANTKYNLKEYDCYKGNVIGDVTEISRESAKVLLYLEIDSILNTLFPNTTCQKEFCYKTWWNENNTN